MIVCLHPYAREGFMDGIHQQATSPTLRLVVDAAVGRLRVFPARCTQQLIIHSEVELESSANKLSVHIFWFHKKKWYNVYDSLLNSLVRDHQPNLTSNFSSFTKGRNKETQTCKKELAWGRALKRRDELICFFIV